MKKTKAVALGGIMSAMCVVIMLLGALIGVGVYAAPMIAGICLIPTGKKYGIKYHITLWLVVSVLSFLTVPDVEESLMFFSLFGFYPIVYPYFEKLSRVLSIVAKLAYFNVVVVSVEYLVIKFFLPEAVDIPMASLLWAIGNATFLLYDRVIPRSDRLLDKNIGKLIKKF
jgi:hypothetical protein